MILVEYVVEGTQPGVIHAQGPHQHKPRWEEIRDAFFATPRSQLGPTPDLTILTCNNGHQAMGRLEQSLDHLGVPYLVLGEGIDPWLNSRDKPKVLAEAARSVRTEYLLYADSRDAIIIRPPAELLAVYQKNFQTPLVFGADRMSWPPIAEFKQYENSLEGANSTEFRYLNGGAWIGRREFCAEFFEKAVQTPPHPDAPESEQGILRKLLMDYPGQIELDRRCQIFCNVGFVVQPVFRIQNDLNH